MGYSDDVFEIGERVYKDLAKLRKDYGPDVLGPDELTQTEAQLIYKMLIGLENYRSFVDEARFAITNEFKLAKGVTFDEEQLRRELAVQKYTKENMLSRGAFSPSEVSKL